MASYASAYAYQQAQQPSSKTQYSNHQKVPPSWLNPPFPGAPPVPAGINPQQWKAGRWQFNPAWNQNQNPQQQHVPWIPSHHWMPHINQQSTSSTSHSQQQQQHVVNPYKRVPRPPSAEYLATELVANPLGLSGLDEPNKYYDKVQTPWVWQPRDLDDEDQDGSPHEQTSESFTAKRELQPTFSTLIVRTPEHYRRQSSGSTPSTPSRGSSRGSVDLLPARMSQLSIGSSGGSQTSIGSSNPNSSDFPSSVSILGSDHLSDEPASILSPLIIAQTPKPTPTSLRSLRSHYTHPLINGGGLDPIPESFDPRDASAKQNDWHPAAIGPARSLPLVTSSHSYAVAQPSPLREDDKDWREKKERKDRKDKKDFTDWRGLGSKHTTFIDPSTANPFSSNRSPPQTHSPATASSHSTPSSHSSQPSPNYPSNHASPPSSYSPGSPPHRKSRHSPPDDSYALQSQSSPATSKRPETTTLHSQHTPISPPPLPVKRPSLDTYDNRRRRGYWNRRGDHLTQEGYIVYAPPGKQFPHELRNYPTEDEGYENHDGLFTTYTTRPELPESLARGGKPPEKPYEGFVIYEYQ